VKKVIVRFSILGIAKTDQQPQGIALRETGRKALELVREPAPVVLIPQGILQFTVQIVVESKICNREPLLQDGRSGEKSERCPLHSIRRQYEELAIPLKKRARDVAASLFGKSDRSIVQRKANRAAHQVGMTDPINVGTVESYRPQPQVPGLSGAARGGLRLGSGNTAEREQDKAQTFRFAGDCRH